MNKTFNKILFWGLIVLWFGVSLVNILVPHKDFSENENKYLSSFPEFTIKELISGEYMKEVETYIDEQFVCRDQWISLQSKIEYILGKREINGVYIGKDNYLFNKFTDNSYSKTHKDTAFTLINDFANKQPVPVSVMLIPSSATVLNEKLPAKATNYDSDDVYEEAKSIFGKRFIDLRESFNESKDKEQLFYKTDHHYTANGAYLTYKGFCEHNKIAVRDKSHFKLEPATDKFQGTLYSKVLLNSKINDTIYIPKNTPKTEITYDGNKTADSPYDLEALNKKDKYTVFFGGNYGTVEINTPIKNGKRLLIIKDSFANSFVPFLLDDYEKIVMLDLRYVNTSASDVIKKSEITEVLFLYETTNLLNDKSIAKISEFNKVIELAKKSESIKLTSKPTTSKPEESKEPKPTPISSNSNKLLIGDSRGLGLAEYGKMAKKDFFVSNGMTVYKASTCKVSVANIDKLTLPELQKTKEYNIIYVMLGINELGYSFRW